MAVEANQVLLEASPLLNLDALLDRGHRSPTGVTQSGDKLSRGNERITGAHGGYWVRGKHGWSQDAELIVIQLGARVNRQWSIILSEHIWPFVNGFCFRSRSDRWCAIEPRGEGFGPANESCSIVGGRGASQGNSPSDRTRAVGGGLF